MQSIGNALLDIRIYLPTRIQCLKVLFLKNISTALDTETLPLASPSTQGEKSPGDCSLLSQCYLKGEGTQQRHDHQPAQLAFS